MRELSLSKRDTCCRY